MIREPPMWPRFFLVQIFKVQHETMSFFEMASVFGIFFHEVFFLLYE